MRRSSDTALVFLTVGSASLSLVSIAASQILFTLACLAWIARRGTGTRWPAYMLPLGAFMAASMLSLAMSPQPDVGVSSVLRKFFLFGMALLAANAITTGTRAQTAQRVMLAIAGGTSLVALAQFLIAYSQFVGSQQLADDPTVLARVTGLMGHWMTFSGEQMLIWCAAVPSIVLLGRRWLGPLALVGAAIILSFTRSVWLGATAGLAVIALALPRKVLIAAVTPVVVVALIASGLIYHRISMSFEQENFAPDQSRLAYLDVGLHMVRDHPLFGVGPERIRTEFPGYYRGASLDNFYYGHLHNNIVQIAAERGLLALAAFLWFIFELYRGLIEKAKSDNHNTRWAALSGLSALTGFLAAGLFEYNFGDSEVLLLFLFLVCMPFGLSTEAPRQEPTGDLASKAVLQ